MTDEGQFRSVSMSKSVSGAITDLDDLGLNPKTRDNSVAERSTSYNTAIRKMSTASDLNMSRTTSVISFDIPELPVRHNFDAKISPYRWAVVFFFILNICAISCMSLSMSPQGELLISGYGVTTFSVDMCSSIFSATYVPMTFVSMFMYSKLPS